MLLQYVQAQPGLWSFLLSAPNTDSWLGIGFSTNGLMVGSSAMVGWVYRNGTAVIKQYYLQDKDPEKVEPDAGDLTVTENSTAVFVESNRMYLGFQLNTAHPRSELLYAVGPYGRLPLANDGLRLTQHRETGSASLDYTTGITRLS